MTTRLVDNEYEERSKPWERNTCKRGLDRNNNRNDRGSANAPRT